MNEFRSRRQFLNQNIKLLLAYGLAQSLWQRQAFAAPSSSSFEAWLSKVIDVGNKLLAGSQHNLQYY